MKGSANAPLDVPVVPRGVEWDAVLVEKPGNVCKLFLEFLLAPLEMFRFLQTRCYEFLEVRIKERRQSH